MNKKWTALIVGASLFLSTGVGAYAGANMTEIKAYLNSGLNIKVDGQPVQLRNAQGGVITPITYDNTTYLPVRAVSDLLKVAIDWDQTTQTVLLGEKNDGIPLSSEKTPSMHTTTDPDLTKFDGHDYKKVIMYDDNESMMLYPKKQYQKLFLQIAALDQDVEVQFQDSDADVSLKKTTIAAGEGLQTIEVDIGGVDSIYMEITVTRGGTFFIPLTTSYFK